ncbi:MAG: winged helix-turn-helix transcriptional regulator [Nocardioidaceae bacterium]
MKRYGQYCPVARAAEVLAERWTLLVIRELLWGNERFNAIARGVPRMSPSLLATRLRELERVGLVERRVDDGEPHYRLTPAGTELMPIVEQVGAWGQRWMQQLREDEYDPALLMLDISREATADPTRAARRTATVRLELSGVSTRHRMWWLVFDPTGIDVCDTDPGQPIQAWLDTDTTTLTRVWLGQLSWADALRNDTLRIHGDAVVCRAMPDWLGVSRFAAVVPAMTSLTR